jgi:divalent metal cation (Fe/Co/Zn/Cd) transporter
MPRLHLLPVVSSLVILAGGKPASRTSLVSLAIRLSLLTIGWNAVAGVSTVAASLVTGSLSLGGFGLNTLIDTAASVAIVWRFRKEATDQAGADRLERRAEIGIGFAMLAVALYLTVQGLHALLAGSHPRTSLVGVIVTTSSLILMPGLAYAKARVASLLGSRALRGDAILTGASAALAALTLAALLANSGLGWWWADPGAALIIAGALAVEATRALMEGHRAAKTA